MEIEPEYQILIRYYLENNSNSELITIIPETAMLFETTTNKHKIDITDIYLFLKFDGVNTEKIKWIKIYNKILNGFEYLTHQTQIDVEHNMEISLLVATNQKIENHYYEEVINSLENRKKSLQGVLILNTFYNSKGQIYKREDCFLFEKLILESDLVLGFCSKIGNCIL